MIRLLSSFTNAVGDAWCQLMHPDPMWPVRGEYQCRVCQRRFPVAWERSSEPQPAPQPIPAKADSIATATASQTL